MLIHRIVFYIHSFALQNDTERSGAAAALQFCAREVPVLNLGPGHRLLWLTFFLVFLSPVRKMMG